MIEQRPVSFTAAPAISFDATATSSYLILSDRKRQRQCEERFLRSGVGEASHRRAAADATTSRTRRCRRMPGRRRAARSSRHHGRSRPPRSRSTVVHELIRSDGPGSPARTRAGTRARSVDRQVGRSREARTRSCIADRLRSRSNRAWGRRRLETWSFAATAAEARVGARSAPTSTTRRQANRGRDFRSRDLDGRERGAIARRDGLPSRGGVPEERAGCRLRDGWSERSSREPSDNGGVGDSSDARSLSGHERCSQDARSPRPVLSNDCSTAAPRWHAEQPSAQAKGPSWT